MPNTRNLIDTDGALKVQAIRVTVHTTGLFFESDTRSGNHASIFLLTSDGNSVRLNMTKAQPTHTMGTYIVHHCTYRESTSSLGNFDLHVKEGLTVKDVLSLVHAKGRDKYRLAPSGLGCRFWVSTVVDDLERSGYISPSSPQNAASVRQSLQYNYTKNGSSEFEENGTGNIHLGAQEFQLMIFFKRKVEVLKR